MRRVTAPRTALHRIGFGKAWSVPMPPASNRPARDAGSPGDLAVVESILDQRLDMSDLLDRTHEYEGGVEIGR
jgi:hypothetical protein